MTTFCTGSGRSWAERRTSIGGDRGGAIEAVSLWVQVDLASGRPAALGANFHDIYGEAAGQRQVSTRLSLPGPPTASTRRPWSVRRVDLDPFDHVNNAAHWAVLEELVGEPGAGRVGRAETEFALPIDLGAAVEIRFDDAVPTSSTLARRRRPGAHELPLDPGPSQPVNSLRTMCANCSRDRVRRVSERRQVGGGGVVGGDHRAGRIGGPRRRVGAEREEARGERVAGAGRVGDRPDRFDGDLDPARRRGARRPAPDRA